MDPKPSPQPHLEQTPLPQSAEAPKAPEVMPQAAPAEAAPSVSQAAPAVMPQLPQAPAQAPVTPPSADPAAVTGPAIADDVDVIEKEWVDKAQDVIAKTKDDPYQEEEQIEGLQMDYLKKRYGKELKKED